MGQPRLRMLCSLLPLRPATPAAGFSNACWGYIRETNLEMIWNDSCETWHGMIWSNNDDMMWCAMLWYDLICYDCYDIMRKFTLKWWNLIPSHEMQLNLTRFIQQLLDSSYSNATIDPAKCMGSCGIYTDWLRYDVFHLLVCGTLRLTGLRYVFLGISPIFGSFS